MPIGGGQTLQNGHGQLAQSQTFQRPQQQYQMGAVPQLNSSQSQRNMEVFSHTQANWNQNQTQQPPQMTTSQQNFYNAHEDDFFAGVHQHRVQSAVSLPNNVYQNSAPGSMPNLQQSTHYDLQNDPNNFALSRGSHRLSHTQSQVSNQPLRRMPTLEEIASDPAKMFENYQKIEADNEKKRARIAELREQNKNIRFSQDEAEVSRLQRDIQTARNDLAKVRAQIKELEASKFDRSATIKRLENELAGVQAIQRRDEYLARPVSSLQAEYNQLKSQLAQLNTEYALSEENQIRQIEAEFREKTSQKMFNICMDIASKNDDPQVKELFLKLQEKWIPEEIDS